METDATSQFDDLSDDELIARIVNRGYSKGWAATLVHFRDDEAGAAEIEEVLNGCAIE